MRSRQRDVPRVTPTARPFLVGYGLSSMGGGLMLPFLALFFRTQRGFSGPEVAALFLTMAVLSIVTSLRAARVSPYARTPTWLHAGIWLQGSGYLLLAVLGSYPASLAAMAVVGIGAGLFYPKVYSAVHELTRAAEQRATFSMRYLVTNVGIGVGAAIGTFALGAGVDFRWLLVANALTYATFSAVLLATPDRAWDDTPADPSRARTPRPLRSLSRNRRLQRLVAIQFVCVVFGFTQLDSGIPLTLKLGAGFSSSVVGLTVGLGALVVVVAQWPLTRYTMKLPASRLFRTSTPLWAVSFAVLLAGVLLGPGVGTVLVVVFSVGQALAECLYSASFQQILSEQAGEANLDAHSAVASVLWNIASLVGPPIGVLIATGLPAFWLPLLCLLAFTGASLLHGRVVASIDPVPAPGPR